MINRYTSNLRDTGRVTVARGTGSLTDTRLAGALG
jgi:hypothetical protein